MKQAKILLEQTAQYNIREQTKQKNSQKCQSKTKKIILNPKISTYITDQVIRNLAQQDIIFKGKDSQFTFDTFLIKNIKRSKSSEILQIDLHIGFFHLWLNVLNHSDCSITNQNFLLDSGANGDIYITNFQGFHTAFKSTKLNRKKFNQIKRDKQWKMKKASSNHEKNKISYNADLQQQKAQKNYINMLLYMIREYAISKIFSVLEIGPKIYRSTGFDLIVYDDRVQFEMELGVPLKYLGNNQIENLQTTLRDDLQLMHMLHFVHLDIKPANILYSKSYNKIILCDFGCSRWIPENITQKTYIEKFIGTYLYSSEDMKRIMLEDRPNFVNLYDLDEQALTKSLSEIQNQSSIICDFPTIQIEDNKLFKQLLILNRLKYDLYFCKNLNKKLETLYLSDNNKEKIKKFLITLKHNNYLQYFYQKIMSKTIQSSYLLQQNVEKMYSRNLNLIDSTVNPSNIFIVDFNLLINFQISERVSCNGLVLQQKLNDEQLYIQCMMYIQLLKQSKYAIDLTVDQIFFEGTKLSQRLQSQLTIQNIKSDTQQSTSSQINFQSFESQSQNEPPKAKLQKPQKSQQSINLSHNLQLIFRYSKQLETVNKIKLLKKLISLLFYIQIDCLLHLHCKVLAQLIKQLPNSQEKLDYQFVYAAITNIKLQVPTQLLLQASQPTQLQKKMIELRDQYIFYLYDFSIESNKINRELFLNAYFGIFSSKYNRRKLKYTFLLATSKAYQIFFMNEEIGQQIQQIIVEQKLSQLDRYFLDVNRIQLKKRHLPQDYIQWVSNCKNSLVYNYNIFYQCEQQAIFQQELQTTGIYDNEQTNIKKSKNYGLRKFEIVKNQLIKKMLYGEHDALKPMLSRVLQACTTILCKMKHPPRYMINFCIRNILYIQIQHDNTIKRLEAILPNQPQLYFVAAIYYFNNNQNQLAQQYTNKGLNCKSKQTMDNYVLNNYIKYFCLKKLDQARKSMKNIVIHLQAQHLSLYLLGLYNNLLLQPFLVEEMTEQFFELFEKTIMGLHYYSIGQLYQSFYVSLLKSLKFNTRSKKFQQQLMKLIENSKYWELPNCHSYLMAILHFELITQLKDYKQSKQVLFRIAKQATFFCFKLRKMFEVRYYYYMVDYLQHHYEDEFLLAYVLHRFQRAQYKLSIVAQNEEFFTKQTLPPINCPKGKKKYKFYYDKLNEKMAKIHQNRFSKYQNKNLQEYI